MRIDIKISNKKYDQELKRVLDDESEWRKRGCFILNHSFPYVDALFVPKVPLHHSVPGLMAIGPDGKHHPMLFSRNDVTWKTFRARIDMTDYDVIAPSVMFADAHTGEPAQYDTLPKAQFIPSSGGTHYNVMHQHLLTGGPFLCLAGIREFYDHPQHDNENWFVDRKGFGLQHILDAICRTCCEQSMPVLQIVNGSSPAIIAPAGGQDVLS